MSTNPFRRSSLKDSSGVRDHPPTTSFPVDIPVIAGTDYPLSLSVNTRELPPTTQKRVNFASPPAIPISPVSYPPSSPESSRTSPIYTFASPALPSPTNYNNAPQSSPFHAEAVTDENDVVIEEALKNAKTNTVLVAPILESSKQDAVRNTLSKFASTPKRPAAPLRDAGVQQSSATQRQTMDVDAFKRLLLTGDIGDGQKQDGPVTTGNMSIPTNINDNGSTTDLASISQRSIFDQGLVAEDSPRSSYELDSADANSFHQSLVSVPNLDGKKKPPPPAPRHGKALLKMTTSETTYNFELSEMSSLSSTHKKPPTPPLGRRSSHNSGSLRPSSSRQSSSSDVENPGTAHDNIHRTGSSVAPPPPPPRPRRPVASTERRQSTDLPTTIEEPDSAESSSIASGKLSDSRPLPPPTRNSGKRASMAMTNAPPPPPPPTRRGRASSRSSLDSQRTSIAPTIGTQNSENSNLESNTLESESRKTSASSTTTHLLADLAALQQEVEEARKKAGN